MIKRKSLISATVVEDSIHEGSNKRITTFMVTMPRIVLAEFNTHRAFSRNSGSSRAIPFKRMKQSVKKNLFIPLAFQKHHKGMQGREYHKTGSFKDRMLIFLWWAASKFALFSSSIFYMMGATKQLANRILEPFMWHTVIFTATEFDNFFEQRCPQYSTPVGGRDSEGNPWLYKSRDELYAAHSNPDNLKLMDSFKLTDWLTMNKGAAEIHISLVAESIYDALYSSTPNIVSEGDWHIPFRSYIRNKYPAITTENLIKISTAISAMVSFTEVGGISLLDKINWSKNIALHGRLIEDLHLSPTEHCAQAVRKLGPREHSNFKGSWLQYRKIVEKTKF